jgi:hypothetical protein
MNQILILLIIFLGNIVYSQTLFLDDYFRDDQIESIDSVEYGEGDYSRAKYYSAKLSLFRSKAKRPLLIIAPGSGFIDSTTAKDEALYDTLDETIPKHYAKKGYAVLVIDYHRNRDWCDYNTNCDSNESIVKDSPDAIWYRAAQNIYAGIRFSTRPGIAKFHKINTNQVFVLGISAGGIASLPVVFNTKDDIEDEVGDEIIKEFGPLDTNTFNRDKNNTFQILAMGMSSAAMPSLNLLKKMDPDISLVGIHSLGDGTVPNYQEDKQLYIFDSTLKKHLDGGSSYSDNLSLDLYGPEYLKEERILNCFGYGFLDSNKHSIRTENSLIDLYFSNFFYNVLKGNKCIGGKYNISVVK